MSDNKISMSLVDAGFGNSGGNPECRILKPINYNGYSVAYDIQQPIKQPGVHVLVFNDSKGKSHQISGELELLQSAKQVLDRFMKYSSEAKELVAAFEDMKAKESRDVSEYFKWIDEAGSCITDLLVDSGKKSIFSVIPGCKPLEDLVEAYKEAISLVFDDLNEEDKNTVRFGFSTFLWSAAEYPTRDLNINLKELIELLKEKGLMAASCKKGALYEKLWSKGHRSLEILNAVKDIFTEEEGSAYVKEHSSLLDELESEVMKLTQQDWGSSVYIQSKIKYMEAIPGWSLSERGMRFMGNVKPFLSS